MNKSGFKKRSQAWSATLPKFGGETYILAIPIKLREGNVEWLYSPAVAEIVQVVAYIGEQKVQFIPVPDARSTGNTQHSGCSWVVYKLRLNPEWFGKELQFVVQAFLPENVEPHVEAWVVERWWKEELGRSATVIMAMHRREEGFARLCRFADFNLWGIPPKKEDGMSKVSR